jgi:hypothetical protein
VGKHPQVILAMYFYLGQEQKDHVKEIYVIFIHLFDSGILLIIDLNKKKGKR